MIAGMGLRPMHATTVGGWVTFILAVVGQKKAGVDRGYTLLLANPIRDNLNELALEERQQFLTDMSVIGDALIEVLKPSIINYSILGNTDRALHAHIHPRHDDEDPEMRRDHPIRYHWLKMPPVKFDLARDRELMGRMRAAIARRTGVIG